MVLKQRRVTSKKYIQRSRTTQVGEELKELV